MVIAGFMPMIITTPTFGVGNEKHINVNLDEDSIGKMAFDYLLKHPELMDELLYCNSNALFGLNREISERVYESKKTLLSNNENIIQKSKKPKIAVIIFFSHTTAINNQLQRIMNNIDIYNDNVNYYFYDTPSLDKSWGKSEVASNIGVAIWKKHGGIAYLKYNYSLFGAKKNEKLKSIAQAVSFSESDVPDIFSVKKAINIIKNNTATTQRLGIDMNPSIIIMPLKNIKKRDIIILNKCISAERLKQSILLALREV